MTARVPKVGEKALFYGRLLGITKVEETPEGQSLTVVEDVEALQRREASRAEWKKLREEQAAMRAPLGKRLDAESAARHEKIHERLSALDIEVSQGLFRISLRTELLSWWESRGAWVSDGRVLSDDQQESYRTATSALPESRVIGFAQRAALVFLESEGLASAEEN